MERRTRGSVTLAYSHGLPGERQGSALGQFAADRATRPTMREHVIYWYRPSR